MRKPQLPYPRLNPNYIALSKVYGHIVSSILIGEGSNKTSLVTFNISFVYVPMMITIYKINRAITQLDSTYIRITPLSNITFISTL